MTSNNMLSVTSLLRDDDLQRGLDDSGIGMWDLDLETRALFWSKATRKLFGVSEHDAVSYELFLSLLLPEDRARTESAIQRSIATGQKIDIQCRIRREPLG